MRTSTQLSHVSPRLLALLADDEPDPTATPWPSAAGANDLGDRAAVVELFAHGPRPSGGLTLVDDAMPAQLLHELAVAEELAANALAATTRASYTSHVHGFAQWCRDRRIDPLAATPHQVALHLSGYAVAFAEDGRPRRAADGKLLPAVAAVSVATRIAAIDKAFELLGRPKPGADEQLRTVLRGIRRTFLVRPQYAKAALDLAGLRRVLTVARAASFEQLRDQALLLLHGRTRATGGQLARLRWPQIVLEEMRVSVTLPPDRRDGAERTVVVAAHRDRALCLVAALRALREAAPHLQLVAVRAGGAALSRQAMYQLLDRRLPDKFDSTAPPGRLDAALRKCGAGVGDNVCAAALRDVAALLTGFFAALRRAELVGLCWRDLAWIDGQVRVTLRVTKTDQLGEGYELWLPPVDDPAMCPVRALTAWRSHVAELLGVDPVSHRANDQVFASVDRYGRVRRDAQGRLRPLDAKSFNEMVQRHCVAAGLAAPPSDPEERKAWRNPFGGHSLRVGFVTEAFRQGLSIAEIAEVTRHRDMNTLMTYKRTVDRQQDNPVKKLLVAHAVAA